MRTWVSREEYDEVNAVRYTTNGSFQHDCDELREENSREACLDGFPALTAIEWDDALGRAVAVNAGHRLTAHINFCPYCGADLRSLLKDTPADQ